MKKGIRQRLKSKAPPSAVEFVEAAARLKEDWDVVASPEGKEPYFGWAGGKRPAFDPAAEGFAPGNAWLLLELSRTLYLPCRAEKGGDSRLMEVREEAIEREGFRERASFVHRANHAALFESEEGGGFSVLCFRGTMSAKQWLLNLSTIPIAWSEGAYVHQGFKYLFDEMWPKLKAEIEKARRPIFYAGHSLGGALAALGAARLAPDAAYSFGSPRVGNTNFRALLEEVPFYRVVNGLDIVTLLPHSRETFAPYDFRHVGELCYLSAKDELLINPGDEEIPAEASEHAKQPLGFLVESFEGSQPPDCLVDHAPSEYARRLARFAG